MSEYSWLEEHVNNLDEEYMTSLKQHLKGRGNKHEIDENSQHIDIVSIITIVSHSSLEALT